MIIFEIPEISPKTFSEKVILVLIFQNGTIDFFSSIR